MRSVCTDIDMVLLRAYCIKVRGRDLLDEMCIRDRKGVSARDMSLSLGQANNYINNIENKKSLPAMQSFFCLLYTSVLWKSR